MKKAVSNLALRDTASRTIRVVPPSPSVMVHAMPPSPTLFSMKHASRTFATKSSKDVTITLDATAKSKIQSNKMSTVQLQTPICLLDVKCPTHAVSEVIKTLSKVPEEQLPAFNGSYFADYEDTHHLILKEIGNAECRKLIELEDGVITKITSESGVEKSKIGGSMSQEMLKKAITPTASKAKIHVKSTAIPEAKFEMKGDKLKAQTSNGASMKVEISTLSNNDFLNLEPDSSFGSLLDKTIDFVAMDISEVSKKEVDKAGIDAVATPNELDGNETKAAQGVQSADMVTNTKVEQKAETDASVLTVRPAKLTKRQKSRRTQPEAKAKKDATRFLEAEVIKVEPEPVKGPISVSGGDRVEVGSLTASSLADALIGKTKSQTHSPAL